MNPYFAVTLLLLIAGTLLLLPLAPALVELHRKSDALPLSVVQQHAGEIRYFADSFRTYVKALELTIQQCVSSGKTAAGSMPDGTEYLVFGRGDQALLLPRQEGDEGCAVMIAAGTDLILPADAVFSKDIYSAGTVIGGTGNRYRAILAEQDVHLGAGSSVLRWVHAVGKFSADPGCKLYGRISSDGGIRLSVDCSFLRLNAPRIQAGDEADGRPAALPSIAATAIGDPSRTLHDGDLAVAAGEVFQGNLVVRGKLHIGAGARVCGSVKSEKDMVLEAGACVEGSLMSARGLSIGRDCVIHGPVIAERTMRIAAGVRCGRLDGPTTVSAPRIEVEAGALVFGTLWAREQGRVITNV